MTQLTKTHIWQYIQTIRLNFENAYKTQNDEDKLLLINSWFEILQNYPKEVCDKAVFNALKNADFAPRVGTIVNEIEKMQDAISKSEVELWVDFKNALNEVYENAEHFRYTDPCTNGLTLGENSRIRVDIIFKELPPELKEYCQNKRELINFAYFTDEELGYEKGRFLRLIPLIKERLKKRKEMSPELASIVQGLFENGRMQIESDEKY